MNSVFASCSVSGRVNIAGVPWNIYVMWHTVGLYEDKMNLLSLCPFKKYTSVMLFSIIISAQRVMGKNMAHLAWSITYF